MTKSIQFIKDGIHCTVPNAFYRISVKLIIKNKNDKLLVTRSIKDGRYELPGGGIDWGETHEDAARRELAEELGVSLLALTGPAVDTIYLQNDIGYHSVKIYYNVALEGTPVNNEPDIYTIKWVSEKEFKKLQFQKDEAGIQERNHVIWPTEL